MAFTLMSTAFSQHAAIPTHYTCDGDDASPPLAWRDAPAGTRSFVLIVDDPDAPQRTWVHWLLYNLPPAIRELREGAAAEGLPPGTLEGINDWTRAGYGGPCPPIGRHRYFYKLYALDVELPELGGPTKAKLEQAMQGHVLAQAELVGTYQRRQ